MARARFRLPSPGSALLATALLAACADGPFNAIEYAELEQAQRRWGANRPAAYTFEIAQTCPWRSNGAFEQFVVHGDSVPTPSTGPFGPLPPPPCFRPTVDGMFDWLRGHLAMKGDSVKDVRVRYDAALGYPTEIRVTCTLEWCGGFAEARNLQPLR